MAIRTSRRSATPAPTSTRAACSPPADGNVSVRLPDDTVLLTPAGVSKARLPAGSLARVALDGRILEGRPSTERAMHLAVYRSVRTPGWSVHAHPPTAIAWTLARPGLTELPTDALPELLLAAGRVPIVPYARPGTEEMGAVLLPFLPAHRLLLLSRHGALAWGESMEEAVNGIERVEHSALILKGSRGAGRLHPAASPGAGGAPGTPGPHRTEAPVKDIHGVALRARDRRFEILDQTRLPDAEVWLDGSDPEAMVGHIQRLSVRGAPLIGVAASLSVAAFAERGADCSAVHTAIDRLRRARPTAVNLAWAMDRLGAVVDAGGSAADLICGGGAIHDEDVAACERMGDLGADLIRSGRAAAQPTATRGHSPPPASAAPSGSSTERTPAAADSTSG